MALNDVARIAVVGVGPIGERHLQALMAETTTQAAAVVDPSPRAVDIAKRLSLPYFDRLDAMLDKVAPDGVIIATPNTHHVPLALDCVARGVPVLVEKPIADTVESAHQLADAAGAAKVPAIGF